MNRFMHYSLYCLTVGVLLTGSPGYAQRTVPGTSEIRTGPASSGDIERAIDQLLGDSEQTIMGGLNDPGLDWGSILSEMLMDKVYEGVAQATVFSSPAIAVMGERYKQKQNDLTKELRKLTALMKAGMERANKLRYQNLKLRVTYQKSMNDLPPGWDQSGRMSDTESAMKGLYGGSLNVINDYYGKPGIEKLLKDEYPGEVSRVLFATSAGGLADTKLLDARLALAKKGGRLTYISPYERLELIRETRREALKNLNGLIRMRQDVNAALKQQQKRQTEKQLRQSLGRSSAGSITY